MRNSYLLYFCVNQIQNFSYDAEKNELLFGIHENGSQHLFDTAEVSAVSMMFVFHVRFNNHQLIYNSKFNL